VGIQVRPCTPVAAAAAVVSSADPWASADPWVAAVLWSAVPTAACHVTAAHESAVLSVAVVPSAAVPVAAVAPAASVPSAAVLADAVAPSVSVPAAVVLAGVAPSAVAAEQHTADLVQTSVTKCFVAAPLVTKAILYYSITAVQAICSKMSVQNCVEKSAKWRNWHPIVDRNWITFVSQSWWINKACNQWAICVSSLTLLAEQWAEHPACKPCLNYSQRFSYGTRSNMERHQKTTTVVQKLKLCVTVCVHGVYTQNTLNHSTQCGNKRLVTFNVYHCRLTFTAQRCLPHSTELVKECFMSCLKYIHICNSHYGKFALAAFTQKYQYITRMWINAEPDGRPTDYRWHPLFNAAKVGWRPLLECRAVTLPRSEIRWN